MSLQVWLPLNGNVENQGLAKVVTSGGTVYANGKIGQCIGVKSSTKVIITHTMATTTNFSMAFWMKIPANMASGTVWENLLSFTGISASGGSAGTCSMTWANYDAVKIWDTANQQWLWAFAGRNFQYDTWTHWCITHAASGEGVQGKIYIDGILKGTYANSTHPLQITAGRIELGRGVNTDTVYYNDFRVYDHALSEKEVKELAKGLVLHYKFDDGYVEGTTNLVPHPNKTGAASAAWDTALHPDAITVNGWSVGYNGGVSSPAIGYHAYWKTLEKTSTMIFNNLNSDYNMKGRWLGESTVALYPNIAAGESYTISFDMKTVSKRQLAFPYTCGGWYYKIASSSSSRSFHDGYYYASNTKLGEWEHFSFTKTRSSSFDGNTEYQTFYIYGQSSNEGTMYVRNIQVEKKDHATPYAGPTGSRMSSPVFDSSGFKYNGTPSNVEIISGSPRYAKDTHFTGSTSKIHVSNLSTNGFGTTYSFVWWGKINSWSDKMFWGFSDGTRLNLYNGIYWNTGDGYNDPIYIPGTTTTVAAPSLNVWHHYAMVRDNDACLLYLDGVLYGQAKTVKNINGTSIYFNGWDSSGSYTSTDMSMSDFRMYSTALSAEDILELYQTSASIDKNGNVYARELVEE